MKRIIWIICVLIEVGSWVIFLPAYYIFIVSSIKGKPINTTTIVLLIIVMIILLNSWGWSFRIKDKLKNEIADENLL